MGVFDNGVERVVYLTADVVDKIGFVLFGAFGLVAGGNEFFLCFEQVGPFGFECVVR